MLCYLYPEPTYLIFTEVPELLYYSHIPATIVALLVGFFVFFNDPKKLLNRLLFFISISFATWTIVNLILWTNIHSDFLIFIWPLLGIASAFISILSIYFVYVFLEKKDISIKIKSILLLLLIPVLVFSPTYLDITGFNLTNCDAYGFEGEIFKFYYISIGIIALLWVPVLLYRKYKIADIDFKKQILLMGIGIMSFLFSFFTMTFLASYLTGIGITQDSSLEMYGAFGMMIFMIFIGILIVRFKTFNVGMIASQALVIGLVVLIGSQFTFADNQTAIFLTSFTLVLTGAIGIILIRSVRKEVIQREQIENLATSLEKANVRLQQLDKQKSEFISIASHQLRSPLTSIRGYASLLLEKSYGEIPTKAIAPISRIEESSKLMALAIEDYLNVSRIESGNMRYNLTDFNLKTQVEHVCDDLRSDAVKRGLVLIFRSDLNSRGIINADIGKTVQVIQNLVHNSIKYTKLGTVKVLVRDDIKKKRIYIDIVDTGIGMNKETQQTIFQKFERAENANSVNVNGTGLGLYVSMCMTEAMGGTITAHSDGDGKGSRFTIELPLAL